MINKLTMDDIHNKLEELTLEEKTKALSLLAKCGVDFSKRKGELTGTCVAAFIFQNRIYPSDSHKDVFVKLTQLLVLEYPDNKQVIFSIKGRKKKYFSTNPSDFKHGYEQINGTDIFVDTNENAAQLNRRCQKLLQAFGIDPTALMIIPR